MVDVVGNVLDEDEEELVDVVGAVDEVDAVDDVDSVIVDVEL